MLRTAHCTESETQTRGLGSVYPHDPAVDWWLKFIAAASILREHGTASHQPQRKQNSKLRMALTPLLTLEYH